MTDDPGQSPAHVIAVADQIHAAIRDKDSDRLADLIRGVFHHGPQAAGWAMLMEVLRQAIGIQDGDDPGSQDGIDDGDDPPQWWRHSSR